MSGPSVSRHGRTVRKRRWGRLRQQWKLLGLFEIDQQHEFYSLTCMMKEGLCAAIQNTIDNPLPVSIPMFMNLLHSVPMEYHFFLLQEMITEAKHMFEPVL